MKGKQFKLLVGLFALVGVFSVYAFYNDGVFSSIYNNDEMQAAEITYPTKIGERISLAGNIFYVTYFEGDQVVLSTSYVGWGTPISQLTENQFDNPPLNQKKFEEDFMRIVNLSDETIEKELYEFWNGKIPQIRTATLDDFNKAMESASFTFDDSVFSTNGMTNKTYNGKTYLYKKVAFPADASNFRSVSYNICISDPEKLCFRTAAGTMELYAGENRGAYFTTVPITTMLSLPANLAQSILEILYTPDNQPHITGTPSAAKNTVIGTITTNPERPYPIPTYTMVQGSDKFTINENNEVLINVDNIAAGTYTFTVQAHQDAFGSSDAVDLISQEFTVVITSPYKQITDLNYTADTGKDPLYLDTNVDTGRIGSVA
ncbi:MAG: hypothetical protein HFE67_07255, partial [Erysipelotrichaceae bacterium]|nr:hypothetical protein [Erysipelotrichaceae bacterium]